MVSLLKQHSNIQLVKLHKSCMPTCIHVANEAHVCVKPQGLHSNPSKTHANYLVGAEARDRAHISTGTTCQCSMYCNYCDKTHRDLFSLTSYSCNGTYDLANLGMVTEDLYSSDTVKRNYETYMNHYCDALYDKRKPVSASSAVAFCNECLANNVSHVAWTACTLQSRKWCKQRCGC